MSFLYQKRKKEIALTGREILTFEISQTDVPLFSLS